MKIELDDLTTKLIKSGKIVIAQALVASSFVFVWTNELIMKLKEGVYLTNGFKIYDPMEQYHVAMYILFAFVWLASFVILYNLTED